MNEEKRALKPARAAIVAVACTAIFAALFIGLVSYLDTRWSLDGEESVDVSGTVMSDPFYVLVIGSDSRKNTVFYTGKSNEHAQVDQHADIITLVRVDPHTYTITLLTIPRDTVLEPGGSKICNALLDNNPTEVVDAVEKLTGVHADYYVMTSFSSFQNLVDALGGITIDVPRDYSGVDSITGEIVEVKAGNSQLLNGAKALVVVRALKLYSADQDACRQVIVRRVERALFEEVLTYRSVMKVQNVLEILQSDIQTNMNMSTLGVSIMDFIHHKNQVTIYDGTGPYNGKERKNDGAWIVEADYEAWKELIALVDEGGDPSFTADKLDLGNS